MADKAALFGINDYASISDLRGCLNDVEDIASLLIGSYRFDDERIRRYRDADVTKGAIRDAFAWLVDGATEGDRLVFFFAGHGSYLPQTQGDEDTDELLCLHGMDWDDPNTYLVDDDLGVLTEMLPNSAGAKLTVILDACHSGSGTRAIHRGKLVANPSLKTPLLKLRSVASVIGETLEHLLESLGAETEEVIDQVKEKAARIAARFVPPPLDLGVLDASPRNLKAVGASLARSELNHQLIASAQDHESAADAFINGEFRGAFTYHLCDAARRLGSSATSRELVDDITPMLSSEYDHTPKLSGLRINEPLFGGAGDAGSTGETFESASAATTVAKPISATSNCGQDESSRAAESSREPTNRELASRILDLSNRAIATVENLLRDASDSQSAQPRDARREWVVYVHGISQHRPGYSNPWWSALRAHLPRSISKTEVLWSDIVNPRSRSLVLDRDEHDAGDAQLARTLQAEIEQRTARMSRDNSRRGSGFSVDDFVKYMTNASVRRRILSRFDGIVRPLLDDGATVHVIAHSWGCVVAYEGLRRLDSVSLTGEIKNLFTVGSALSISTVQNNLFSRVGNGALPRHVQRIINLDAGGDAVGGAMGDSFAVFREYLGLDPVGCSTIPFTNNAWSVSCAHASYFRAGNIAVNREVFAKHIRDS